jgi:hypothetical protein
VNDDGRADLVVTEPTQDRFHLLLGDGTGTTGDGTFTKVMTQSAGDLPNSLVAGDFVGDGVADFLTANQNSDDFSLRSGACDFLGDVSLVVGDPQPAAMAVVGQELLVTWAKGDGVTAVDLEISRDGGARWQPIAGRRTGSGFSWTVTPPVTVNARVRVKDSVIPSRSASSGTFTITDNPVDVPALAPALSLSSPWPSPARGDVQVTLSLSRDSEVIVEAMDVRGRIVETLHRGPMPAGSRTIVWRAGSGLGAGLYFLRARFEGGDATRRVVRLD